MQIHIRPFTGSDADYNALHVIQNAVFPEYKQTVAELRRQDSTRDPKCFFARYLGEADGQVITAGLFGHMPWMFHPQRFMLGINVHPEYQRQGVGDQMYNYLLSELAPRNPLSIRNQIREDYAASLAFAQKRGFVEDMRAWESRIDIASFDPTPFAGQAEKIAAHGIRIATVAELQESDPDFWQKFYDLDTTLGYDVPSPDPYTPTAFEQWMKYFEGSPNFIPDGIFVALDGDKYVGLSALWRRSTDTDLETGLTGVRREYRRKGIALALKLRALAHAKQLGAPVVRTDNESNNRPMLSINEALGFVKQPAWIGVVKHF